MGCYIDVVGCTNNDDHNGIDKGDCPYCEIDRLTAQLADRDAEIARLQQQSVGWVAVFDENLILREEVERLKAPLMDAPAAYENGCKQTAQEIIQYIIDQGKIPTGWNQTLLYEIDDSDITELRQRYGLEGWRDES